MSVYRDPAGRRGRTVAVVAVVAALLGVAGGYALARATDDDPSLADQVAELRERVEPALSALELVTIEYPQAVRGGEVVAETEYEAVESQLASAAATLDSAAADLSVISPREVESAEQSIADVEGLVGDLADPADVERAALEAREAVALAAGMPAEPSP